MVETSVIYEQASESGRHNSDSRMKFLGAWLAIYSSLSVAFVWVLDNAKEYKWLVVVAAAIVTLTMWFADQRSRAAMALAREVGQAIEEDAHSGIPEKFRYFSRLAKVGGPSHSSIID